MAVSVRDKAHVKVVWLFSSAHILSTFACVYLSTFGLLICFRFGLLLLFSLLLFLFVDLFAGFLLLSLSLFSLTT